MSWKSGIALDSNCLEKQTFDQKFWFSKNFWIWLAPIVSRIAKQGTMEQNRTAFESNIFTALNLKISDWNSDYSSKTNLRKIVANSEKSGQETFWKFVVKDLAERRWKAESSYKWKISIETFNLKGSIIELLWKFSVRIKELPSLDDPVWMKPNQRRWSWSAEKNGNGTCRQF